ncbi:hypothetical protein AB5I41_19740 [Sphingomonas sp. MMS24-JH45]
MPTPPWMISRHRRRPQRVVAVRQCGADGAAALRRRDGAEARRHGGGGILRCGRRACDRAAPITRRPRRGDRIRARGRGLVVDAGGRGEDPRPVPLHHAGRDAVQPRVRRPPRSKPLADAASDWADGGDGARGRWLRRLLLPRQRAAVEQARAGGRPVALLVALARLADNRLVDDGEKSRLWTEGGGDRDSRQGAGGGAGDVAIRQANAASRYDRPREYRAAIRALLADPAFAADPLVGGDAALPGGARLSQVPVAGRCAGAARRGDRRARSPLLRPIR